MQFSVQVGNDNVSWSTLRDIAKTVDNGSWHTLWNYDHLVPPHAELLPHLTDDLTSYEEGELLEGWSILSAWAAHTRRVRLGCLVTAIPFRKPALLAKMAVTVDHISEGRLELGLGAGWHVGETRSYGIALGEAKEKLDRFEEGLEVITRLLGSDRRVDFKGRYFTLDSAPFSPPPVTGKLPILIGGGGEKRTLKLVARYADSYNFFANTLSSPELYAHKNRVLDEHCAAIGRDPSEIKRTVCLFANLEPDEAKAKQMREAFGKMLDEDGKNALLFGSAQRIIDGTAQVLEKISVAEVIFCGLTPHPEHFAQFDEEVLSALGTVKVAV